MNLREKVRAHLVREARQRGLENARHVKALPADVPQCVAREVERVSEWHVDWHLDPENARKKAELCEFIVRRFGNEFPPELVAQIGTRGKWNRETVEALRAEKDVAE